MTKMITITRKPHMNRVYVTGEVDTIRDLLSDMRARHDEHGYWLALHQESRLRAALAAEAEYQAAKAAGLTGWQEVISVIPADYKTRHGALLGGTAVIDRECMAEPSIGARKLPWRQIAEHVTRVRDMSGRSTINGRVRDSDTLYSAVAVDGRIIYRVSHMRGFGDDLRETYYLPADLWTRMMSAEVQMRGITQESAAAWLARYRGCVGTELYEFAIQSLPGVQSGVSQISASASVPGVVTGHPGDDTSRI